VVVALSTPTLSSILTRGLPHSKVSILDKMTMGISSEAKEAALFAVIRFLSLCGRAVPIMHLAESKEPKILGMVTPGENYGTLMDQIDFSRVGETLGRIQVTRS